MLQGPLAVHSASIYAMTQMKLDINLDESPGKTVGRRRPPADPLTISKADSPADARAWQRAFGGLRIPKGVYRFRTHEEADAWLWKMITRPR
jgi:hypothetical protein